MLMSVLAIRGPSDSAASRPGIAKLWHLLALVYFTAMAVRLAICVHTYGSDYYLHGAIPVAFHWVLALFAVVLAQSRLRHCPSVQIACQVQERKR